MCALFPWLRKLPVALWVILCDLRVNPEAGLLCVCVHAHVCVCVCQSLLLFSWQEDNKFNMTKECLICVQNGRNKQILCIHLFLLQSSLIIILFMLSTPLSVTSCSSTLQPLSVSRLSFLCLFPLHPW